MFTHVFKLGKLVLEQMCHKLREVNLGVKGSKWMQLGKQVWVILNRSFMLTECEPSS